ncbi:glycosyltransferase family 4 protein [Patescibacteria group bacterium]|nr:glycosyltransferase family 4 protein [Patescibacteria group bacterium]
MNFNCQKNKKIIGIDARFYGSIGKGLGRYTQEIIDRIVKNEHDCNYVIFLSPENHQSFLLKQSNIKKIIIKSRWYTFSEQFELPYYIYKEKIDLMHFPHFNVPLICTADFIVTIHDLILTKFPTLRATKLGPLKYLFKNLGYRLVISSALIRAQLILAVSEFTRNDIVSHFKVSPDKIIVSYEGVADLYKGHGNYSQLEQDNEKERKALLCYNVSKPYFLYVGNAYPHKNLEGLLRVFNQLESGVVLVLVGKEDYFYRRVKEYVTKLNLQDRVIFSGFVEDHHLIALYRNALAYVFPSFYEGFGLPPLEAMAWGCPVISSCKGSMPEVLGDAAIYFDPNDDKSLLEKLKLIINNKEVCRELIRKGKLQVQKYSWQDCAQITKNVYIKCLKNKRK